MPTRIADPDHCTERKSNALPHDAAANKMDNAFRWGGARPLAIRCL